MSILNLHPYSDCCPYRRNGKGLAYQTSERTGEMSYQELKIYLRHAVAAKRSKPRGRTLRLRPEEGRILDLRNLAKG